MKLYQDTIMLKFGEMIIKRKKDQIKFKSSTCGDLTDVIKTKDFGIMGAKNIGITEKHYHKKLTEVYHLLRGKVVIEVQKKDGENRKVELNTGDVLVIQPYEIHKIINTSKVNELLVTCVPDWTKEDEIVIE